MNFNDLYKMVVEKVTIQPNTQDPFEQKLINYLKSSEYNLDKIVSWYRRDKKSGVPQNWLEQIYTTNLDDMVSTLVDYYTEDEKYRKRRGNDPRFLKNPFEQYRYSKGFIQNMERIKREINELRDENIRLANSSGKKKDENGEFDIRPEDETRIKLIDSSTNVMVWSTEGFDTTNRFIFNFWGNANMNVGYYDPTINSPYCTRIRDNWEAYSETTIIEPYQQIWFFLKPEGNYDYSTGDLTNPSVAELFRACNLQGPKLLLCMDDTAFDLLDRYDENTNSGFGDNEYINPVIDEVKKLDKRFRDRFLAPLNKLAQDELIKTGEIPTRLKPFITRIEIPNRMKSIRERAFYGCSKLTSVTIPDSVTSIGASAFSKCYRLASVTIPDSVMSIGECAFQDCARLTSITIPDNVTSIGASAFSYCSRLTSITIPNSVTSIGERMFCRCIELVSVTIPDSVTSIGKSAFADCSGLTSVTIPDSVTSIEDYAFFSCRGLTSVTIPDGVTSIGYMAFYGCRGLKNLTIPDSVTSINNGVFSDCSGLTSITIPNSATSIGYGAFEGCSSLTRLTIPDSMTRIGDFAFYNCNSLKSVTIGNSVTSIGDNAFEYCCGLTNLKIPNSVTSIGDNAFQDCKKLTIQTTPRVAELLRNSEFEGDIEIISDERETNKPEGSFMREFVEVLKMEEY